MMNCELLATCSALGYLEGDTYHKEPDCLGESFFEETLKKKKTYLNRDLLNFSSHGYEGHMDLGGASSLGPCKCLFCP